MQPTTKRKLKLKDYLEASFALFILYSYFILVPSLLIYFAYYLVFGELYFAYSYPAVSVLATFWMLILIAKIFRCKKLEDRLKFIDDNWDDLPEDVKDELGRIAQRSKERHENSERNNESQKHIGYGRYGYVIFQKWLLDNHPLTELKEWQVEVIKIVTSQPVASVKTFLINLLHEYDKQTAGASHATPNATNKI